MVPNGKPWSPEYRTAKGSFFQINDCSIDECPVSFITPESRFIVDMESSNRHAKEATGAALFGPDSGRWPAIWYDSVVELEIQRVIESNVRFDIEKKES